MGTDATGVTGLHLFEAHGVEIEYMIVAREGLDVLPVADEVLLAAGGEPIDDVDRGTITWSNEIVLHVIELKTSRPETRLEGLAGSFLESIREIQGFLAPL